MFKKLKNSILFGLAAIFSGVIGLCSCILIIFNESLHGRKSSSIDAFLMDEHRTMSFYKVFSSIYDTVNSNFYSDNMRSQAAKLAGIIEGSNVLDVGCGTGYTTETITDVSQYGNVVGVDITVQQLKRAHKKLGSDYSELNLSISDVMHLPFREDSFEAIVSVGAIEYFSEPGKAIIEMSRTLKPNKKNLGLRT